jgi:hypothetical protein
MQVEGKIQSCSTTEHLFHRDQSFLDNRDDMVTIFGPSILEDYFHETEAASYDK